MTNINDIDLIKKQILEGVEKFEGQLKREQPEAFCEWPKFCLFCAHEITLNIYNYLPGEGGTTLLIVYEKAKKILPNYLMWNLIISTHSIENTKEYYPNTKPREISFYDGTDSIN